MADARALVMLFCLIRLANLGHHRENYLSRAYSKAKRVKKTVIHVLCGELHDKFLPQQDGTKALEKLF